ncbi:cobaltochelatase subunit CobN [Chelativorans sp. ZYF759]|uniref:cobaltochelatase subunit CobN n=1 Tax=Chelativorans sp. ZYF759 TaxID=2692213 RepID=UPI00145CB9DE|nr:cobaltochelatase subunit CobN [Chelativorans sp. ZYF759]NMG38454.1 cobaltochelatase subunit CobN [Chelativorans sp. ZYF759]
MHLLATSTATLDDLIEPIDLAQQPAEMVVLSFSDSDLSAVAAAWRAKADDMPTLRLAALRDLRHPMSVDLWLDTVAAQARIVLVRVLGGYEWWRYGCDRLSELARKKGIHLALLPGECREHDERLSALSTLAQDELSHLLECFREGGPDNMEVLLARMARLAGKAIEAPQARQVPKAGFWLPDRGMCDLDAVLAARPVGAPCVPILFYRSMLLAADIAPIEALCAQLGARGIFAAPLFVSSLKDGAVARFIEDGCARLAPSLMISTTAFASGAEAGAETLFDRIGVPVFQAVVATTRREAWESGERGLAPADLAMHVVLPELDGRILAGAISFKDVTEIGDGLDFRGQVNRPEPDRVAAVAERVAKLVRLQWTPPAERKVTILIPDYPAATGRTGYAVGLDVPQSVLEMLHDLKNAGYHVDAIPENARDLLRLIDRSDEGIAVEDYVQGFEDLPAEAQRKVVETWGARPHEGGGRLRFRAARFGNITVALAPDRGRSEDRRSDYHDPTLAPRHELIDFGIWLRQTLGCHALIHVGAHGTLEWLPGKTVALSQDCFPEIVTGGLPVIYPFIVSNPGEAAQAKRRIAAITIGHLPPPLTGAGLSDYQQRLERLVDEYAQADGLDRRRRDRLGQLIVETARKTGLATEAGIGEADAPGEALMRIDAWLCDLKDFAIKDGLHIYGRAEEDAEPIRLESAERERSALLAALDGRHIPPGPAGAPARGRTDVLPTGRNLFAADPRTMPTPTAFELGKAGAEEVLRSYLQEHGDWPTSLVFDLWGSQSLRTGGEEIAQGLALMGCRPQWDHATGRVTGIEVLPPAVLGRPRIDVTWRISGLFRDMFPTQIALMDAAVAAVAARNEDRSENPLAASMREEGKAPARIFGSRPGTYGAGIEEKLASGSWEGREELGHAYLAATSHSYGGADGDSRAAHGAFAERVGGADLLVHTGDDPGRDILEGSADVAFIGGFAAAVAALGGKADLVALDTTDPQKPRARSVGEAVTRTVRARAINPRFIEGQLRHGPRGAAEFAETVDRLVGFAETTQAIPGELLEAVHDAYLGDERVRDFILDQNPAAARSIAERFLSARRRGLWHPLRNSIDADLMALIEEAQALEAA